MNTQWRNQFLMGSIPIVALTVVIGSAFSQSPTDDFARHQAEQQQLDRLETLPKSRLHPVFGMITPENARPAQRAEPCFSVENIKIGGVRQFTAKAITAITKPYQSKCIGLSEINALLRELTHLYLNKGYVTSRAYVPEQDLASSKTLRLTVIEGALSDIYLNGSPLKAHRGVLTTAFPGMKGGIVNIRDVEQGLDQINRLSSNNARTMMLPGKTEETSILNVENEPDLIPWHFSVANSNLGQKQTGYSKSSISFHADNVFSINDLIALSYEHSGPDYPGGNDGSGQSNSYSSNANIPYGYWTFSVNGSWYEYDSAVPGNYGTIETSGDSKQLGFSVDRVILRDKDSITTLNAGLTYKTTNNFLLGNKIEVGSRVYSVGSLGISHSHRMLGGLWVFDAGYEQGLDLFGAVDRGDPGAGNANPTFAKFTATINATKPFEMAKQRFEFTSMLSGQYSPDNLFGAEQMSLGSYSNVRGSRDSLLFGNNGFFSRNELTWHTVPWTTNAVLTKRLGEFRPYVGIDYGHVFSWQQYGMSGGDITSWTAGARLAGGNIFADIGYSGVLSAGADTQRSGLFYFSTSVRW